MLPTTGNPHMLCFAVKLNIKIVYSMPLHDFPPQKDNQFYQFWTPWLVSFGMTTLPIHEIKNVRNMVHICTC